MFDRFDAYMNLKFSVDFVFWMWKVICSRKNLYWKQNFLDMEHWFEIAVFKCSSEIFFIWWMDRNLNIKYSYVFFQSRQRKKNKGISRLSYQFMCPLVGKSAQGLCIFHMESDFLDFGAIWDYIKIISFNCKLI